jgi:CelD/BcsL family acetyltransferase involved in cellulose biosynthesis
MARFYRALAVRFGPVGGLRGGFARLGGVDVGYILGAVRGDTYRGLQLAHDQAVAPLSVGNLLQWHQLVAVADEGVARYDLGMDMPYKVAWADERLALTTRTLVVVR